MQTQKMHPRQIVSRSEAARLLGVSVGYLAYRAWKGGGPAYSRIGQRTFYDVQELMRWIDEHKVTTLKAGSKC